MDQLGQTPIMMLQDHLADNTLAGCPYNCEHVLDACAELVEQLLRCCWRGARPGDQQGRDDDSGRNDYRSATGAAILAGA